MSPWVLAAAALAGAVTTLTGSGGSLVLTAALLATGPASEALTVTGPALLVGKLHRLWLYRREVSWPHAWRYAAGGLPGALVGGLLAVAVPEDGIRLITAAVATLALLRTTGAVRVTAPAAAMLPGGVVVGLTAATSAGGGLIASPLLLSAGLSARAYVGTSAVGSAAVHVGRLVGYGAGGWVTGPRLAEGLVLAGVLTAGNAMGDHLRAHVPDAAVPGVEIAVVLVSVGLALAGLA